jgi:MFS family permease
MPPLFAVAIVVFLEVVCLGAIIPVLPDYAQEFGGGAVWTGVLFMLVAAPKVVMNPLWGRLSDRRGRRPTLAILTCGAIAGSTLWALAPTLGEMIGGPLIWLAISRLVYGVFSAQAALAYAVASDTSPPEKRAAAMGVLGATFGFGITVGFPLGGIIGSHSPAAVGWLCAGSEFIALTVIVCLLRETRRLQAARESTDFTPRSLLHLAAVPAVMSLLPTVVVVTVGLSVMTPTLRPLTEAWYGFNLPRTSHALLVWGLVGSAVQAGLIRPLVRAIGETATVVAGAFILAGGFALLADHLPLWGFWCSMVLIALGGGLMIPALTSLMSLQVSPHDQGGVHGLNQSATALGRALGYLLGGALYAISPATPYWAGAAILIVGLLPLTLRRFKTSHAVVERG